MNDGPQKDKRVLGQPIHCWKWASTADRTDYVMPEGKFEENMVVSVEMYARKVGEQDGVKLKEEVWITADGPVIVSLYPDEAKLLGE